MKIAAYLLLAYAVASGFAVIGGAWAYMLTGWELPGDRANAYYAMNFMSAIIGGPVAVGLFDTARRSKR